MKKFPGVTQHPGFGALTLQGKQHPGFEAGAKKGMEGVVPAMPPAPMKSMRQAPAGRKRVPAPGATGNPIMTNDGEGGC